MSFILKMTVRNRLDRFEFDTLLSFWGHCEPSLLDSFRGDFACVLFWRPHIGSTALASLGLLLGLIEDNGGDVCLFLSTLGGLLHVLIVT